MKTLVIISDLHSGSIYGLTPPGYYDRKNYKLQKEAWKFYRSIVSEWNEPDILLCNGDMIEGRQEKQGGAELLTNDRNVQSDMAIRCIEIWNAKNILMTYGTKYHVSDQAEDFEYMIADKLHATIEGRLYFNVEGVIIDARHKVGSSSIPHGRATSLLREVMWNLMKESLSLGPKVSVVIRSHVHYHLWVEQPNRLAFTTPSLQISRGRYGSRECIGETHWGAIRLTIDDGQIIGRDIKCMNLLANRHKVLRIR